MSVARGAQALFPLLLAGCQGGEVSGFAFEPGVPEFTIAARSPAPGRSGVPLTVSVVVTFSTMIDPSSVQLGQVSLNGSTHGTLTVDGSTLRFTPVGSLTPGTTYTVAVSPDVHGANRVPVGPNPTWGFKTTGVTPPIDTILAIGPRPR